MSKLGRRVRVCCAVGIGLALLPTLAGCHSGASSAPPAGSAGSTATGQSGHGSTPAEMFSHMKKTHP